MVFRVEEVVEVARRAHGVELFPVEVPPERLHGPERAGVPRRAMVVRHALEVAHHLVGLREVHGLAEPGDDGTVRQGVVDEVDVRLRLFAHVRHADDEVGQLAVLRLRDEPVQFQERTENRHRRDPGPRPRLVDRDVQPLQLRDQMVRHLLGGLEACRIAGRPVKFDQGPKRVLLPPDVVAPMLLVVGRRRVLAQEVLLPIRGEVTVRLLVRHDEPTRLVPAPGRQPRILRVADRPGVAEHRLAPVLALPADMAVRVVPVRREGPLGLVVDRPLRMVGEDACVQRGFQ